MNFLLSDEQMKWQKLSRAMAEAYAAEGAEKRDEEEVFSRELYNQFAREGFSGICFPAELGGRDGDCLSYILAAEELAKVDDSLAVSMSASVMLCQWPIMKYGSIEQKNKYLMPLVQGNYLGAFALTEAEAGTDAGRQQSVAVPVEDGYVLNGQKIFITNGGEADIYVIFAMTDKNKGIKGITAFILEKDMPGFQFGKIEKKMGIRSSVTRELIFKNVKIPVENRLGKEGEGFKIAMSTLDGGRISVAAQALGIAQAAFKHAVAYAETRIQFGAPIIKNQGISFLLADIAVEIEAARLLTYKAAIARDCKKNCSKEAAMAKVYASDTAVKAAEAAVQILGGRGYLRTYPVERLFRDAKITQIFEGTNQVQRMVIANSLKQVEKKEGL